MATPDACVLIVEDNDDIRALYSEAVEMEGHHALLAANGQEAFQILRSSTALPKLILLDLMMPVMDGWEFLKLRSEDPVVAGIPTVVCSASKDRVPAGVEFIRKPVDLDRISGLLQQYCPL